MFQHFFIWALSSRLIVPLSECRMYVIPFGVWIDWSGTALTWPFSFSGVITSSCSRNSHHGLLGVTLLSCSIQNGMPGGGGIQVVHRMAEGSPWTEATSQSAISFPTSPECPRTQVTVVGARRRFFSQYRKWSQRKASGDLYSSRGAPGAMAWRTICIADVESVRISSGAEGGVMSTAVMMAMASILVELSGSSVTRPRKSMGVAGP